MAEQLKDPGIGEKFNARSGRVMNRDGTFNVRRSGFDIRRLHLFQYLIRISWMHFFLLLLAGFAIINLLFAFIYLSMGNTGLRTSGDMEAISPFWQCFFFSLHTLTTVGYGNFYPYGYASNAVAGIEAMLGLLGFAVATGMVYGRFSRPTAKMAYSKNALIVPYKGINALMFRMANMRAGLLMEIHADISLTYVEKVGDQFMRRYYGLHLERNDIIYLTLTWTLVHLIDEDSPFYGKSVGELEDMQLEILVKIKGYDEGFGEHIHSRYSYLFEDIVWGAKFVPAFHVDEKGMAVLDYEKISRYDEVELNPFTNTLKKQEALM
jgi:inward rectifier potassium channel